MINDQKIADIRRQIEATLAKLDQEDDLGSDAQKTVILDQTSVGRVSRMDAMQQQAMAKATQTRRLHMRTRIKAALARMDEGAFGFCVDCGEDIPLKRLELDPTIPTCVSCATG